MAVNSTLINTLDRTIAEDFGNTIMDANFDIDPWSQNLVQNSMGVTKAGLASQYISGTKTGWTKVMLFRTGLGGQASWRATDGPAPVTTGGAGTESQFLIYGTPQTFPIAGSVTAPAYVQAYATLRELNGTFRLPLEISRADQIDTNVTNQVGAVIEASARRVALREILAFWGLPGAAGSSSGTIDAGAYIKVTVSGGTRTIGTATTADFTASDGYSRYDLAKLQNGEAVTIVSAADGTILSSTNSVNPVFVQKVDPISLTFSLARLPNSSGLGSTPADVAMANGDWYLFPYGSLSGSSGSYSCNAPTALQEMIVNSGSVFGLALASHPQFKSMVIALTGGETTPSETVFNKYIGGYMMAKPASGRPDSLVTTPGVKVKYINHQTWVGRRERFSVPVKLGEGFQKSWDYEWDGMGLSVDTSMFCPSGTLFALRLKNNNFQKLTPPPIPGTGSDTRFGTYVEFIGNTSGTSIFVPARTSTAQYTDEVEAPFKRWVEYVAEYFYGMKLSGFDEDIATS